MKRCARRLLIIFSGGANWAQRAVCITGEKRWLICGAGAEQSDG